VQSGVHLSLPFVKTPILILQGDRDIQVSVGDAEQLARLARDSSKDVTLEILPGLDHLFKPSPKVRNTVLYGDSRRRFSAKAVDLIIYWMFSHCVDGARTSSRR
jgi:dipeptidyl aminopeptidase/acylaminoacyl peptidase